MSRSTVKAMSGKAERTCVHHSSSWPRTSVPTAVGVDPLGHVADEVGRPELEHGVLVAGEHGVAVLTEDLQVLRHRAMMVDHGAAGLDSSGGSVRIDGGRGCAERGTGVFVLRQRRRDLVSLRCHAEVKVCRGCIGWLRGESGALDVTPTLPVGDMDAATAFYEAAGFDVRKVRRWR